MATRNSSANSNTMLEKTKFFLRGQLPPLPPPPPLPRYVRPCCDTPVNRDNETTKIVVNKVVHLQEPAGLRVVREARQGGVGGGEGEGPESYNICVCSIVTQINNRGIWKLPSQGMSVYPPNTYGPFLMIVTVCLFPSHLLWKVLTAQPCMEAR